MTFFSNIDAINHACRTLGLDASSSRLLIETARPTIWLRHSDPAPDVGLPVRTSKVGGEPDLPPELAWPVRPPLADCERYAQLLRDSIVLPEQEVFVDFAIDLLGKPFPMAFLAQVDLEAMAHEQGFDPALPDRGMLWAFNDSFADWYGPQSPHGGITLLWSDASGLRRHETPALLREAWQLGVSDFGTPMVEPWDADIEAEPLSPISGWTVNPRRDQAFYHRLADERFEFADGGGDQLGGWEVPLQQDMHGDVEMIATGPGPDNDDQIARARERWRHVLTINAETYLSRLMPTWGDGAMYMFVDEKDLAECRFDRAVGTSQMT
ncbi:DUF1963 domain-containing protein [Paracoccaceae bacterium GXU_MW_L88]